MRVIKYPERNHWPQILARPSSDKMSIESSVRAIIEDVKLSGDDALRRFTEQFDGVAVKEIRVSEQEIGDASHRVPDELKDAIRRAKSNIEKFHLSQREEVRPVETSKGVVCWRRSVGIEKVGIYIPAGTAPLFSSVLMLAVPAKIAGCKEVVLCTPPGPDGRISDAILYTADICGVTRIFRIGGAQAIAALAYGTETAPVVYKIFGPGNQFVTCAKQVVSCDVAIDMAAGPSEVAVLADDSCNPAFVAADLLSQAEHGPDSQVILVSTSETVIQKTIVEIGQQIERLPRRDVAERSIANSSAILVSDVAEGIELLDQYAPEHLILAVENAEDAALAVVNAGSVFIGNYSCESFGDYASGTNHTLPTAGFARAFSGVSLDSFVKKITFQKISAEGIRDLGPAVEIMAAAEGLEAHKNAVTLRLEEINAV